MGETTIKAELLKGRSCPLGATVAHGGVNFSLFSRSATGVELLFFDMRMTLHHLALFDSILQ